MGVRETSLIAFQEERKNINTSEARVLDVIENANHPMNISLVADALGMEKSSISGRINALVKKGLIFSVGKYKCPMTGKSTLFYISGRGIDEQMELMFN